MSAHCGRRELDLGFVPGTQHGIPPPISLGTAEVCGAYRTPERPVKAGKLAPDYGFSDFRQRRQALDEIRVVGLVVNDLGALAAPAHDAVQGAWGI